MEPAEVYAAAGYRGVQIALPATETFITTLASGQTPNELHALYPASTKQVLHNYCCKLRRSVREAVRPMCLSDV